MNQKLKVKEIPIFVNYKSTLEIASNDVNYFTHGFFKYPCKFIPHIPRWAILKYTKPGDLVLDPFAGSGTTLVEAVLLKRNAIGVDFDRFSQLLCKTKTSRYAKKELDLLHKIRDAIVIENKNNQKFEPDLHNLAHWFPRKNVNSLKSLKSKISFNHRKNKKINNFLNVCFASTVRKCSYADDVSPKPYVSTRIEKKPLSVKKAFFKTLDSYLKNIESYKNVSLGRSTMIANDARKINAKKYLKKVSLAITSPPYINAFDYVRSLRLENAWLGNYGDSTLIEMKKKQVGTETVSSKEYSVINKTGNKKLDDFISKIKRKDEKRAFVVQKFFADMSQNISEVRKLLKPNGHYVIVIGNSRIREISIPTHDLLIDIAKKNGFELDNLFSYVIKNRYIRIPRSGRGGLIKKDWVIDLVKKNSKTH